MSNSKVSRNDPCPCGSGKKYKQCCLNQDESNSSVNKSGIVSDDIKDAMEGMDFSSLEEAIFC